MTVRAKTLMTLGLAAAIVAGALVYRADLLPSGAAPRAPAGADPVAAGGTLNAALRADPRSFNPLTATDASSSLVGRLLHASLVRVNRTTDQVEPWLAERIDSSPDGLTHTFTLR